ncbi:hypothetical protein LIT38_20245 [Bacillus sp. CMF12]|uniref:hypothetical protein n=1 Tax=Bacillus sp. CMF12 TaxID=2884834 RepID=UPI002079A08C|nr:hypothetical protein [Bacillus sp. CMF12]USK48843.1 hypothetical protein LIT38_20245 [Bacillus sp. CMF12]
MSEISCVACKGKHFRKGYYEVDVDVSIYSTALNKVRSSAYEREIGHINVDVAVDTDIYHNEINSSGDLDFRIVSEGKKSYDEQSEVYRYVCEDCGYILSFTKEKQIESKYEEKKRKEKENSYDWSNFGK